MSSWGLNTRQHKYIHCRNSQPDFSSTTLNCRDNLKCALINSTHWRYCHKKECWPQRVTFEQDIWMCKSRQTKLDGECCRSSCRVRFRPGGFKGAKHQAHHCVLLYYQQSSDQLLRPIKSHGFTRQSNTRVHFLLFSQTQCGSLWSSWAETGPGAGDVGKQRWMFLARKQLNGTRDERAD